MTEITHKNDVLAEAQAVLDAEVVAIMEEWRTLSQPMSERLGDKHRLDAFVRVGQASADMLERLATERARQSAAIAKAQDEIADLCLPLAETDTDYDWGVKVGGYTCLTILDRHLAPLPPPLASHRSRPI